MHRPSQSATASQQTCSTSHRVPSKRFACSIDSSVHFPSPHGLAVRAEHAAEFGEGEAASGAAGGDQGTEGGGPFGAVQQLPLALAIASRITISMVSQHTENSMNGSSSHVPSSLSEQHCQTSMLGAHLWLRANKRTSQ